MAHLRRTYTQGLFIRNGTRVWKREIMLRSGYRTCFFSPSVSRFAVAHLRGRRDQNRSGAALEKSRSAQLLAPAK